MPYGARRRSATATLQASSSGDVALRQLIEQFALAGEFDQHPVARHLHHILGQRGNLGRLGPHLSRFVEPGENLLGDANLVGEDAAELNLD